MDLQERQARYLQKVLESELERVRMAGRGERNAVLFKAAATLAGFVASGALSEEDMRAALDEAGSAAGLDRSEIRATVRSGFKAGRANPREGVDGDAGPIRMEVRAPPPPRYPPTEEIRHLWDFSLRLEQLDSQDPIRAYLRERALEVQILHAMDLVRVLPDDAPEFAWRPRPPNLYPMVIPVWDATGSLRSLRFRAVGDPGAHPDGRQRPKACPPWGFEQRGLVMADGMAHALLSGAQRHGEASWDGRVVVCEGEPDWWSWAANENRLLQARTTGKTYAVFGIVAGSWSTEIANRIPDQSTVIVRTDQNPAGDRYAQSIYDTLSKRCILKRPAARNYGAS